MSNNNKFLPLRHAKLIDNYYIDLELGRDIRVLYKEKDTILVTPKSLKKSDVTAIKQNEKYTEFEIIDCHGTILKPKASAK